MFIYQSQEGVIVCWATNECGRNEIESVALYPGKRILNFKQNMRQLIQGGLYCWNNDHNQLEYDDEWVVIVIWVEGGGYLVVHGVYIIDIIKKSYDYI